LKSESIKITVLEAAEIEKVLKIQMECNLTSWNYIDYLKAIQNDELVTLVAKTKKEINGFIVARLIINKDFNPILLKQKSPEKLGQTSYSPENEAEIYSFAIAKKYQNKGIGKQLFSKFKEMAKKNEIDLIWLEVRKSNINAIEFYKKNNFSQSYQRKNYYNNPTEDGIVMKLVL
jgi:ribosomal-protein-alanine N-acetyltransferase